ncbi:stress-induced-phosphoprotein 1-like [Watersipora subatra]|uniref:stress-induced-phosphoprotein 1-like n=1 Tax=Watersipora subatra TaxID=2589382 RepID=UPI00355AD875
MAEQAKAEKEKGNAAYKAKRFDEAISHYDKAIELEPDNIVYYTNKAAVYFEQTHYDLCIETCGKAVEVGRANRADFKLIAKALARAGFAYLKQDDLDNALLYYNKSLSECRDPAVVKKAQELQKMIKEKEERAYENPEMALEEKQKGNKLFTEGNFPAAVAAYTESIKRNRRDAKVFSNRSACYAKLMAFPLALTDAEECIKLDPTFVKGYLRKATCHIALKENSKAELAYQKALELDPKCQEALDGYRKCATSETAEEVRNRAMNDPEVQAILGDPAMRLILEQMQKDPKALKEHLQNPAVAGKIQKLLESGLIAIR